MPVILIPRYSIVGKSFVTPKDPYENVCDNLVLKKKMKIKNNEIKNRRAHANYKVRCSISQKVWHNAVTLIPRFTIDGKSFVTAKYPYDNVCDNIVFKKNEN